MSRKVRNFWASVASWFVLASLLTGCSNLQVLPEESKSALIVVENVKGLEYYDALRLLSSQGALVLRVYTPSTDVEEGIVVSQVPEAGTEILDGTAVSVYVSSGESEQPNEAKCCTDASSSSPKPSKSAETGGKEVGAVEPSTVEVEHVYVPSVLGLRQKDVQGFLSKNGFKFRLDVVSSRSDRPYKQSTNPSQRCLYLAEEPAFHQQPAPGSLVANSTKTKLEVWVDCEIRQ
jgi:hypothetical protein